MADETIDNSTVESSTDDQQQQQQPTSDYIDNVYKALKLKVGGFNVTTEDFRKAISTNDTYRTNVYNALKQKVGGFNVTPDDFSSAVKKNGSANTPSQSNSTSSNGQSNLTASQNLPPNYDVNKLLGAEPKQSPIVGDIANLPQVPKQQGNTSSTNYIQQVQATQKDNRAKAAKNTALNVLKDKGLPNTPQNLNNEINNVNKSVKNGDLDITYQNGVPYYGRVPSAIEQIGRGFYNTLSKTADAIQIAGALNNPTKLAQILDNQNQRKDAESRMNGIDLLKHSLGMYGDYYGELAKSANNQTPLAEPTFAGKVGEMGGGLIPYAVSSELGLLPLAVHSMTSETTDKMHELYDKYQQNGMSKENAAVLAAKHAPLEAAPNAALNTLLFKSDLFKNPNAPLPPAAKNLSEALYNGLKSSTSFGLKNVAAEAATIGAEQVQGDQPHDIFKRLTDKFGNGFLLDATVHALPILASLPKYMSSAIKEYATQPEVRPLVDEQLKNNPNSDNIKEQLDQWDEDKKPLQGVVPEDKMATVNGLNQKINSLKEQQRNVPDALKDNIQSQIDATNDKIAQVVQSDKPAINFETDDKTGQPIVNNETNEIQQPTKVKEPTQKEVNQPIGEAKEAEPTGENAKGNIEPKYNNIEVSSNYRTANAGNHEGQQEFTHFIVDGKRLPIEGNEDLLKDSKDAKLDKSKESQTDTKRQQTENIKKWNVPLDDGTENPKGEYMGQFVSRVVGQYEKDKANSPDNSVIMAHSSVLKTLKTYEALKDKPLFKDADWNNLTKEQQKAFTDHYTTESTNNGDIETYDNGKGGKIRIARHGQTEDNLTGKFRTNDTQLTEKGRTQAKKVGTDLGEEPPKIISSDLPRAVETANLAMDEINKGKELSSKISGLKTYEKNYLSPLENHKSGTTVNVYRGSKEEGKSRSYGDWWTGSKKQAGIFANEGGEGIVSNQKLDVSNALRTKLENTKTYSLSDYSKALGLSQSEILNAFDDKDYDKKRLESGILKAHEILEDNDIQNALKKKGYNMVETDESHGAKTVKKSYLVFKEEPKTEQQPLSKEETNKRINKISDSLGIDKDKAIQIHELSKEQLSKEEFKKRVNEIVGNKVTKKQIEGISKSAPTTKESFYEDLNKGKKVLETLYPDAELVVHDNREDLKKATGVSNAVGLANFENGKITIHLSLDDILKKGTNKTIFHEIIHPIIFDAFGTDSKTLTGIWNRLYDTMKDVPELEGVFEHMRKYDPEDMADEGLTEFFTQVVDGKINIDNIPKSKLAPFIEIINKLFKAIGIDYEITDKSDFNKLATSIKKAFQEGDLEDVKKIVSERKIDKYFNEKSKNIADEGSWDDKLDSLYDDLFNDKSSQSKIVLTEDEEKNNLTLQNGKQQIVSNRLSQEEKRGYNEGGEIHKEAANIIDRLHESNEAFGKNGEKLPEQVIRETANLTTNKTETNAIPKQTAGEMGVRNEAALRPEVGRNDQPENTTQQGKSTERAESNNEGIPPTNTEKETTLGNEEPKTTGIKKAVNEPLRINRNLPEVELPKAKSKSESLQLGKTLVDSGEINPVDVVNRVVKNNGIYTTEEANAMQYYMHQLDTESKRINNSLHEAKTALEENPLDEKAINNHSELLGKLNQLNDDYANAIKANRINSNSWGRLGNIMNTEVDQNFNPVILTQTIKENYGGELPSDVKEKLDKLLSERDEAIRQQKVLEDKLLKNEAEKNVNKIKEQAAKDVKRKQTKQELLQEEKDLKEKLRAALKKDLGQLNAGIPIPKETLEVLGKLAINYVKQGVLGLDALVDKMYNEFKDDVERLTKNDIRKLLASEDILKEVKSTARDIETEKLNKKAERLESKTEYTAPNQKGKMVFEKDNAWVRANQRVINAEYKLKRLRFESLESKKNFYQKSLMWLGRGFRLSLLSGYNVLSKLASAATIGGALKRIPEQAIGKVYSTIFSKVSEKAPIEGNTTLKAELNFYKEFFNPKKFYDNTLSIIKTGESNLSKKYGQGQYEHIPILYLPTDLHQVIKDPLKRATFEASLENYLSHAEKNGLDITDDLVRQTAENAAYKRANYEVFQEKNAISKWFNEKKAQLEKNGNVGATGKLVADFLIPVSTVPTNIVKRIISTSPAGLIRGGIKLTEAYRKGIENLSEDEAELVMKQLKQGSLGTALWMAGWFGYGYFGGLYTKFNPDRKRGNGLHSDEMDIDGTKIPKPVQHALPLEIIQTAATARRTYELYKIKRASSFEAISNAGLSSIGALAEQIPLVSMPLEIGGALTDKKGAEKLGRDLQRRVQPTILKETGIIKK